ncbi:glycosyltransferase family 4 protein, partial [Acinetobacter bereziniae]|uniref:glycosyltransferase family 4 protein n=1 Tax=Acinetobacter bereziniae TaxID=106648 RepID=UPI00158013A2
MKKVCFLIGNMSSSGGTERVTSIIANELVSANFDIFILSLINGEQPFFSLNENIHLDSLYTQKVSMKKNFLGCCLKIRKYVQEHEIETLIVVDSISCVFTVPALFGLKINHICWEHFNFNVDLGIKFRNLGRKWAAKYCDHIVTLTKRDKILREEGLSKINAKITPIANPTPYTNTKCSSSLEFKSILALGRLTFQKGFDLLIEAWGKVCQSNSDWKLYLVGDGEDEAFLKAQAKKLNIIDRISFSPATKNVEQYYLKSSFYCMSSRFEGLPMVLLEAQAHGLPIISFDCDTGPSEIILNNMTGYLVPNLDVESLANSLLKAISLNANEYS